MDYKRYLAWNKCENEEQKSEFLVAVSEKYTTEFEDYQKNGPPLRIYEVNVKGFWKQGIVFTCGCALMISYHHTMKFLPSPGWRKLFPISSSCLCQLQGWAHTKVTLPDHSFHLHVYHPLDDQIFPVMLSLHVHRYVIQLTYATSVIHCLHAFGFQK